MPIRIEPVLSNDKSTILEGCVLINLPVHNSLKHERRARANQSGRAADTRRVSNRNVHCYVHFRFVLGKVVLVFPFVDVPAMSQVDSDEEKLRTSSYVFKFKVDS